MATGLMQGDEYIRSNESDNPDDPNAKGANYGQNGDPNASSYTGKRVNTGFLPDAGTPINSQMHTVSADPITPAHGMKAKAAPVSVPPNNRPSKRSI
jgi:hypothetical protein